MTNPHPETLSEFAAENPGALVYIGGPMTGIPEYNFPAFRAAARELREHYGLEVISPVEMDEAEGFEGEHEAVEAQTVKPGDDSWASFLGRDVVVIADPARKVRAVVGIDGWENSTGFALESHVARSLGKPIYQLSDERLIKYPSPISSARTSENIAEEAVRLVQPGGQRHEQYGHPLDDFTRSAAIISAIIGHEVRADQIPLIMIAVKISRICQTPTKRDSWVDVIGYALTAEMAATKQDKPLA